jgi:hypothetical protein
MRLPVHQLTPKSKNYFERKKESLRILSKNNQAAIPETEQKTGNRVPAIATVNN